MPKLNRPNLRRNIFEPRAQHRIGRLKSIARKLVAELENIEESGTSKGLVAVDFYEEVKRFEVHLIVEALTCSEGHQLRAARLLNINPSTLNAKIKQYGIETNTFSRAADAQAGSPLTAKLRVLK
jgi:DNA-binding NtrC family response regulator